MAAIGFKVAEGMRAAEKLNHILALPKGGEPVIGDLGGVSVSVPINYTFLTTEYDGDPNVLAPERSRWIPPVRTYESKINSLAMVVHLPDFLPRTAENEASYYRSRKTFGEPEEWLEIGVSAGGQFFIRDDVLKGGRIYDQKKMVDGFSRPVNPAFKQGPRYVVYLKKIDLRHGLIEYQPIGFPDNSEANPYNYRLFFHEVDGRSVSYIRCSANGSPFEGSARNVCVHKFVLYPVMMAEVSLRYDARSLYRWKGYERKSRALILGFRIQAKLSGSVEIPSRH